MAAVSLSGITWPTNLTGRLGPFQDTSGNLWIVCTTGTEIRALKSSDGGSTWGTTYLTSTSGTLLGSIIDSVFDSANGVIYVLAAISGPVIRIYSFNIGTTTWARVDSGTGPTVGIDVNGRMPAFLTRRSTGEFVIFYQGPTHSLMGNPYRTCYYARCSAAGVWSAGVEVSGAVKLYHYDCKSACLGALDRVHMFFKSTQYGVGQHRSLSSANALDTVGSAGVVSANQGDYWSCYYNVILGKVVSTDYHKIVRATSGSANPQTWTADANEFGSSYNVGCAPAFIYDPSDAKLYAFYLDATTDDLYYNIAPSSGITWGTPVIQDVCTTVTGISVGLIYDSFLPIDGTYDHSNNITCGGATTSRQAMSFVPSKTGTLTNVMTWLAKYGAPSDDFQIEIQTDNAGSPSDTVVGTVATISGTSLSTTLTKYSHDCSISLTGGTTYWLVFKRSGNTDASNYYIIGGNASTTLPGQGKYYDGSWGNLAYDLSVGLYSQLDAIGVVFNDSNVYFDKYILSIPGYVRQYGIRGRKDDGTLATASYKANQDVGWSQTVDQTFRILAGFEETAGASPAVTFVPKLEYKHNNGAWTEITPSSSVVKIVPSIQVTDNTSFSPSTDGLTGESAANEVSGYFDSDGTISSVTLSNQYTSYEWAVQIVSTAVANGDTIQVRSAGVSLNFNGYETLPTITVVKPTSKFVQGNSVRTDAGSSTQQVSFPAPVGSGNAVVVLVNNYPPTVTSPLENITVTDDKNGVYTRLDSGYDSTNQQGVYTYIRTGITDAPQTITVTYPGSRQYRSMIIAEYNAGQLDGHNGVEDGTNQTNHASPSVTPTVNDCTIIGAFVNQANTAPSGKLSVGDGYILDNFLSSADFALEDFVQGTAAAITTTFTTPTEPSFTAIIVLRPKVIVSQNEKWFALL